MVRRCPPTQAVSFDLSFCLRKRGAREGHEPCQRAVPARVLPSLDQAAPAARASGLLLRVNPLSLPHHLAGAPWCREPRRDHPLSILCLCQSWTSPEGTAHRARRWVGKKVCGIKRYSRHCTVTRTHACMHAHTRTQARTHARMHIIYHNH